MILNEDFPYLRVVVSFTLAITSIHLYLDYRQLKALNSPNPPPEFRKLYKAGTFKHHQEYSADRLKFGALHSLFDTAISVASLCYGYYPLTWNASGSLIALLGLSGEIPQTIAWVLLLTAVGTVLGLPWSVYKTFVLEAKHEFNKTTPRTFVLDIIKTLGLTFLLAPPVIAAVVWILQHTGPKMVLGLWGFLFALSVVMMTVYPTLIAPLFNKYTPLPDGPLRAQIEALASSLSFPLRKLFLVDGSQRSAHSNAYMYGFFKNKRIVLYDTLVEQCSNEEVVAVLAHELGHWKLGHTPVLFVTSQILLAAQLALFSIVRGAPGLYEAFGFAPGQRPVFAALVLFQSLIGPLDEVLHLARNVMSRRYEYQADGFAVELGHGKSLGAALRTLHKENKGPPNVDPLYSAYHFSHPHLPERLRAIDAAMKKEE